MNGGEVTPPPMAKNDNMVMRDDQNGTVDDLQDEQGYGRNRMRGIPHK